MTFPLLSEINISRLIRMFLYLHQNLPSCSINIQQSFQKLPKICSTWSLWCKENEEGDAPGNFDSTCDQQSTSSANLTRVPPKLPRHHRKMPFRRRNWCGCIQVSQVLVGLSISSVHSFYPDWFRKRLRTASSKAHYEICSIFQLD